MDLVKITSKLHTEINGELATGEKFVAKFIDGVADVSEEVFHFLRDEIHADVRLFEEPKQQDQNPPVDQNPPADPPVDPPANNEPPKEKGPLDYTDEELAQMTPQKRGAITKARKKLEEEQAANTNSEGGNE